MTRQGEKVARIGGRIDQLADRGDVVLDTANQTFETANTAISGINDFTTTTLGPLGEDLRTTSQTATRVIDRVGADAQRIAGRLDTLAGSATTALADAQNALRSVDEAATGFGQFTTDQLTPLTDDLRTTSQTANRVIDDVGTRTAALATRLDTLTGEASQALATFSITMNNADETLGWITTAMTGATDTLDIATQTFANANKVIRDDIGGIITDLRAAASNFATTFSSSSEGVIGDLRKAATAFTDTVQNASTNIDAVSTEVLAASRSAASFADTLDTIASGNERQISEFLRLGLPEFLRFTEEARSLTVNLERLVNKIERDPGRFLLGTQNSRFSR
ncbi:hypothetical protein [Tateyamaria sp. SN3-11]|uniref:hypothetical protein n=1 Tax=Tateyamaria sp. SN3-11 TaxID=3092147 RepID=UPI0039E915CF